MSPSVLPGSPAKLRGPTSAPACVYTPGGSWARPFLPLPPPASGVVPWAGSAA